MNITPEIYAEQKTPRFGSANPERMTMAFWEFMVPNREAAWNARMLFNDTQRTPDPVWCFHRFGTSITEMPDGRLICVGGEHEDFYDPDFYIYNDVIALLPSGQIEIYGYPEAVFGPTDFHTATLWGDHIYLIGTIGYSGERDSGATPVYRLDTNPYAIERLTTTGDHPGWISRHEAQLDPESAIITIRGGKLHGDRDGKPTYDDNDRVHQLDLRTLRWSLSSDRYQAVESYWPTTDEIDLLTDWFTRTQPR